MSFEWNPKTYAQRIGMLTSSQFRKLQELLVPLTEAERYEILFNQLKIEIEQDNED